jgi:hypothetical protein
MVIMKPTFKLVSISINIFNGNVLSNILLFVDFRYKEHQYPWIYGISIVNTNFVAKICEKLVNAISLWNSLDFILYLGFPILDDLNFPCMNDLKPNTQVLPTTNSLF